MLDVLSLDWMCRVGRCCYLLEQVAKVGTQTRKLVGVEQSGGEGNTDGRGTAAAECRQGVLLPGGPRLQHWTLKAILPPGPAPA